MALMITDIRLNASNNSIGNSNSNSNSTVIVIVLVGINIAPHQPMELQLDGGDEELSQWGWERHSALWPLANKPRAVCTPVGG